MEFRRITNLPPYVFTIINGLKIEARRAGSDVIDLGFGNPDVPSPDVAVAKLAEAAQDPRNHRYSASRGIPKLREAVSDLYRHMVHGTCRSGVRCFAKNEPTVRPECGFCLSRPIWSQSRRSNLFQQKHGTAT
jgi:hypothetical protein